MSLQQCETCENAIKNLPKTVCFDGLTPTQLQNISIGLCLDCPHLQAYQEGLNQEGESEEE